MVQNSTHIVHEKVITSEKNGNDELSVPSMPIISSPKKIKEQIHATVTQVTIIN